MCLRGFFFFCSSRRRHTILQGDWSSDVCSSDLIDEPELLATASRQLALALTISDNSDDAVRALESTILRLEPSEPELALMLEEIGRASCRERVAVEGGAVGAEGER